MKPEAERIRPWFPMERTPRCCIPTPHVRVEGLNVWYDAAQAIRDVTLTISKGCVTAIVGPSGCGKSTFLTVLNRMTDAVATCVVSGLVQVADDDVLGGGIDVRALRRRVGLIFQRPNPLPLSIADNG